MTERAIFIRGGGDYYFTVSDTPPELGPLVKETLGAQVRRIGRFVQLALIGAARSFNGATPRSNTSVYLSSGRGDMEMTSHAWGVLKTGAITATIKVAPPVPLADLKDRKDLALKSERAVRRDVLSILRGREDGDLIPVEPSEQVRRAKLTVPARKSEKWT